jgi:hypothetical protein
VRALAVLAVAGLLGACGGEEPAGQLGSAPVTDLRISVRATEGGAAREVTLACDPAGGDHPDPAAACAVLEGAAVLDPLPADRICTEQYGGPETARITGVHRGRDVSLQLARSDGCLISQWDSLGAVLPR